MKVDIKICAITKEDQSGFQLFALHPNALNEFRRLKPSIPHIGMHGIPLRDEIELQMFID
jgi:hypothetical protein